MGGQDDDDRMTMDDDDHLAGTSSTAHCRHKCHFQMVSASATVATKVTLGGWKGKGVPGGSKGDKVVGQSRARRVVFVVHAAKLEVGVLGLLQPVAHFRENPSVASLLAR